jgi:excisionase family DNA binding protein
MITKRQANRRARVDEFSASGGLPAVYQAATEIEPHQKPLHDVPAIARRLGVCEKTVRRFIARDELRAYRIGRQLRVSEEEYLRFLDVRR